MSRMFVTCAGGTYFNREHYVQIHLPLALKEWGQYGLETAAAYFPAGPERDSEDIVSIGVYTFRDREAMEDALNSAATATVMADVPNFTDAVVERSVFQPMQPLQVRL